FVDVIAVVGINRVRSDFSCARNVRTCYDDPLDFRWRWCRAGTRWRRWRWILRKRVRRDNERDSDAGCQSHAQESEHRKSGSDHISPFVKLALRQRNRKNRKGWQDYFHLFAKILG